MHLVSIEGVALHQVDDASNLEYQAGQDEEQAGDEQQDGEPDKKKAEAEKQQQSAEGEQDAEAEEEGPEGDDQDGGVNEDTTDKHEDRQFAQPEVTTPTLKLTSQLQPQLYPCFTSTSSERHDLKPDQQIIAILHCTRMHLTEKISNMSRLICNDITKKILSPKNGLSLESFWHLIGQC